MNKCFLITLITFATMFCVPIAGMSQEELNESLLNKMQEFIPYFMTNEDTEKKIKELEELIENGADVNSMVIYSPLHIAVLAKKPKIVLFLLGHGANIDQIDYQGNTPLRLALNDRERPIDIIKILIQSKANFDKSDLEIKDRNGDSLLHIGIQLNDKEIINLILQNSVNINSTSLFGDTPLSLAILYNNEEMANLFLEKGANPNILDACGNSAFHDICRKDKGKDIFSGTIKNSLLKYGIRTGLKKLNSDKNCYQIAQAEQSETPYSENLQKIKCLYELEYNTPLLKILEAGFNTQKEMVSYFNQIETIITKNKKSIMDTNIYNENALFITLLEAISALDAVENKNTNNINIYLMKATIYLRTVIQILAFSEFDKLSLKEKIKVLCNKSCIDGLTIANLCKKILNHPAYISNNFALELFPKEQLKLLKDEFTNILNLSESLPKQDLGMTMGSKESLSSFGNILFEINSDKTQEE